MQESFLSFFSLYGLFLAHASKRSRWGLQVSSTFFLFTYKSLKNNFKHWWWFARTQWMRLCSPSYGENIFRKRMSITYLIRDAGVVSCWFFFCTNSLYKLMLAKCDQRLKTIFLSFFLVSIERSRNDTVQSFFLMLSICSTCRAVFLCHWLHTFESHIAMHFICCSYVWSWRLERYIF